MAKKIFYVSRTEDPQTGTAGAATLNRADQPQLMKVYDTVADAEADLANIDTNEIVGTKEVDLSSYTIVNRVADGNLNPVTSNAVANALSYSTTETLTGGTWIDGKPIYRRVYNIGDFTGSYTLTGLTSSVVDTVVNFRVKRRHDSRQSLWVFHDGSYETNFILLSLDNDQYKVRTQQNNLTIYDAIAVIEYTKTGD